MFDIGASELLLVVIVAIIVIGPKDLPLAMRTAGRWIGKVRRVSSHFRTGLDAMVREAELEELEKKWKSQNEEIMARTGSASDVTEPEDQMTGPPAASAEAAIAPKDEPAKKASAPSKPTKVEKAPDGEPQLPFGGSKGGAK